MGWGQGFSFLLWIDIVIFILIQMCVAFENMKVWNERFPTEVLGRYF